MQCGLPDLALLLSVISFSYGWLLIRKLITEFEYNPLIVNSITMLSGGFLALITSVCIEKTPFISEAVPFFALLSIIIFVSNIVCHTWYTVLLKKYSQTFLILGSLLCPFFTQFYRAILFYEAFSWNYCCGFLIIFTCLLLYFLEEKKLLILKKNSTKQYYSERILMLMLFCSAFSLIANENLRDKEVVKGFLKKMFVEDQELHKKALEFASNSQENVEMVLQKFGIKEQNFNQCTMLEKIICIHGWPKLSEFGKEAAFFAWIIVQHADHNVEFQKKCLKRIKQLIKEDEAEKRCFAYLYDRIQINQNKLQRYGTQIDYKTGLPKPLEDPLHVNERRTDMGLESLEEYLEFYKKHAARSR